MFCKHCGKEVERETVVCPYCGVQIQELKTGYNAEKSTPLAIVGFVLAFFIPIAGLICSIIGYNRAKRENAPNGGLALAGIIISIISIILTVLLLFFYFLLLVAIVAAPAEYSLFL